MSNQNDIYRTITIGSLNRTGHGQLQTDGVKNGIHLVFLVGLGGTCLDIINIKAVVDGRISATNATRSKHSPSLPICGSRLAAK
ncbi:hypothetical protein BJL95_00760 [Methylomonas sp. LWB]|nr:hypothetical protein BJL95_00760 [Methylomonas sp. LWB]